MPNPIATPLVIDVDAGELTGLVHLDSQANGVAVVTINQPRTRNALNGAVAKALGEAFETLHGAEHVRIVFLRGANGTFCSGADPSWLKVEAEDWTESDLRDEALLVARMLHGLTEIPALTVALVEREAIGDGAGLVAACDYAIAVKDARFGFPEVASGAVPTLSAPVVVNAIGPRQAKALFVTGRQIDAEQAERIGLIHEVVEDSAGLKAAAERLTAVAMLNGPRAVAETKRVVWDVWTKAQDHSLAAATAHRYARASFGDEGREGLAAMLEGRPPSWANA